MVREKTRKETEERILESYEEEIPFNELPLVKSIKEGKPFVSICIPLWEKDKWFDKLIKSIEKHDAGIDYEICIGEGHNSTPINRNVAQRKAKSNYICQLDGDAEIIQDGWLGKLYESLMTKKKAGIVGCIIEYPNGKVDHCGTLLMTNRKLIDGKLDIFLRNWNKQQKEFIKNRLGGNYTQLIPYEANKEIINNQVYSVTQTSGVCFLYDKRNIGLFPELVFEKAGWEDADFMMHCIYCGFKIYTDGRVRIKHPNHERTKEEHSWRDKEDSKRGFNFKNFLNYMLRWGVM